MKWIFLFISLICLLISFIKRQRIPKQIFLTYKSDYKDLHQVIKDNIDNTKRINPGYQVRYYSNDDALNFIKQEFPEYLDDYNTLVPGAYKADLLRLLLLYRYGGVYNDIGHVYLEPLSTFISNESLVVCKDMDTWPKHYLHNAFIASVPKHPVIKEAIDVVTEHIRSRYYGNTFLDPTGPGAFGKAFNRYFKRSEKEEIHVGMFRSDIKVLNHPGGFIEKLDGKVIKTKFDNYYEIAYPGNKGRYHELWNDRKIYAS